MIRTISFIGLSVLALTGCAFDQTDAASDEQPILITEVRTRDDGAVETRSVSWSRADLHRALRERIRMAAEDGVVIDPADLGLSDAEEEGSMEGAEPVGEAAQAIQVDPYCYGSSLWISDNGTWGDLTHMICFADHGYMDMPSEWKGQFWGAARTPIALWGGQFPGRVWYTDSYCDVGCSVPFTAWEQKSPIRNNYATTRFDGVSLVNPATQGL